MSVKRDNAPGWSIVCPICWPMCAMGRSALMTSNGKWRCRASATAGARSSKAVPDVTQTATGSFNCSAMPNAKNPALRSSVTG